MITLNLNGKDHQLDVTEDMPLLWAIRDVVGYTGTFHWLAAACSSICRAAAPQRRMGSNQWRMLREPSVSWLP